MRIQLPENAVTTRHGLRPPVRCLCCAIWMVATSSTHAKVMAAKYSRGRDKAGSLEVLAVGWLPESALNSNPLTPLTILRENKPTCYPYKSCQSPSSKVASTVDRAARWSCYSIPAVTRPPLFPDRTHSTTVTDTTSTYERIPSRRPDSQSGHDTAT